MEILVTRSIQLTSILSLCHGTFTDEKLQGTAYDKHCQRRIFKRSHQSKNSVKARLILRQGRFETPNMTRTDKAGLQQWTAVSSFLGLMSTVKRRYVRPGSPRANAHKLQKLPFHCIKFRILNLLTPRNR